MHTQLKQLNIAELLDRALRLYRANLQTLSGIALMALGPMLVLKIISVLVFENSTLLDTFQNLVQLLASVALTAAVAQAYLWEPISISEAYKRGWKRFGATWAASFLIGLAMVIPTALILCVGGMIFATSLSTGNLGAVIIITIILLPAILFLGTRFSMIMPATTLELKNGSQGISRSWQLTDGYFWHCLGVTIVAGLLIYVISALPGLFIMLIPSWQGIEILKIIELVIEQATLVVTLPLNVCVTTLLYYDLRVRKEGYDLELRAGQALENVNTDENSL